MIRDWGMGSFKFNISAAYEGRTTDNPFADAVYGPSAETSREIELEIKKVVDNCLNNVRDLLRARRDRLDRLAQALLEKETLSFREIAKILEPERSAVDIEKEALELAEKRLIGKEIQLNLEAIRRLPSPDRRGRGADRETKNGSDNGKNGSGDESEHGATEAGTSSSGTDASTTSGSSEETKPSEENK
jgi:hypothetical protein